MRTPEEAKAIIAAFKAKPRSEWKGFPRKKLDCIDRGDELRLEEIAALKLDTRKRWFRCKTTHGQHCCGDVGRAV